MHTVQAWTYDGGIPGPSFTHTWGTASSCISPTTFLSRPPSIGMASAMIEMDGVPDVSQPEVKHGETFTYDFVVRDAGLYWYHPHVMSAAQVGFGLYGALLVEDSADGVNVADQLTLVLSDIGFDRNGTDPADSGGTAGMVFGREGHTSSPTVKSRFPWACAGCCTAGGSSTRPRAVSFFSTWTVRSCFSAADGGLQEHPETSDMLLITPGNEWTSS